ncbi:hypothetical protein Rhe02_89590 [Rhizocola hellebori]|uniref:FtsH ternary system domain-containing protein n=1 Tax=Rhizocola hellebori TaxID=1392758 RepID=A0A8J3QJ12_9ACTN|nr:hypothetical protein [Rhizocola hellebori]GIH10892.1 hypothetical protein Rhe02_89590 [Rhizocola hellebori]
MRVQVTFRFDPKTGVVEEFLIDDVDGDPSADDHNEVHDRIAEEFGSALDRLPDIGQVEPGTGLRPSRDALPPTPEWVPEHDPQRRRERE